MTETGQPRAHHMPQADKLTLTEHFDPRLKFLFLEANRAPTLEEVRCLTDDEIWRLDLTLGQVQEIDAAAYDLMEARKDKVRAEVFARMSPAEQEQATRFMDVAKRELPKWLAQQGLIPYEH